VGFAAVVGLLAWELIATQITLMGSRAPDGGGRSLLHTMWVMARASIRASLLLLVGSLPNAFARGTSTDWTPSMSTLLWLLIAFL
jgi:hypothetical protein